MNSVIEDREMLRRVEALKIACDVAHKMDHFASATSYSSGRKVLKEDLDDVLKMADAFLMWLSKNDAPIMTSGIVHRGEALTYKGKM